MNDCHLEKARMVSTKENLKVSQQDTHYNARLKSSVASASPSTSLSSQQSKCSNYSYAASLYKSVISNSILYNDSRGLLGSSELHSSVKKFGETMWLEYLNTANEWQIEGFVEKYKKMKDRAALLKGSLHKKVMTFERWWCVLTDELDLCIQGSVENKSGIVQTEPIIKRIDSHTVASRNSLCKLKNFRDEDCDVPHFIKNRFSCGFPKDWELLRRKWIMFLKAGEPQDFQWKGNDNAAILDSCSSLEKPPGRSLQESSCEEFRKKTQKRNFAFSPLPADTVHGLDSNNAIDEKCDTNSTGNQPRLEEERTNCVMPKRNKPECSNTVTTTKNHFLATERSFDVISDSEDSSDEDNGIVDLDTNCQEAKINDNQYGNKKQSVVMRRTNTPQTLVGTEILLEKWLPILNGRKLCFKGVRSMGSTYIDHTTASVKSRPKSDTVTLVDGNTCKLIGQFHDVHNCKDVYSFVSQF
ncbi:uncharacterized protein LOC124553212 [Schistocerca americana]|uniref:uncharacterized protein LOC124553212 n=1 Tax=Schistocerca americana TaxID=7009 RepID=UPI001F4F7297|nr:uncharacterized protein LOC124553212 [Schistocerca americana]